MKIPTHGRNGGPLVQVIATYEDGGEQRISPDMPPRESEGIDNRDDAMELLKRIKEGSLPPIYLEHTLAGFLLECFKRDAERLIELEAAQQNILDTIESTRHGRD